MVLKNYFWIYFGVLLACAIALAVVVKPLAEGFAANGKKPFLYGGLTSVLVSLTAYSTKWITDNLFIVFWILALIFLLFGIIHQVLVHKKYFHTNEKHNGKVLFGEIIFGLSIILFAIVIFSTLKYFINPDERDFLIYPMMMSAIAFFIPMLFVHTFNAAWNIPPAIFKTWQYPLHQHIDLPAEDPREKTVVMAFEIGKKKSDKKKTYFRARAPEGMKLGDLYYHFINDYNEEKSETPIEYARTDHEPHTWWFRRKPKWYQLQRILDPDITVRENGVKENTIIICERLENNI